MECLLSLLGLDAAPHRGIGPLCACGSRSTTSSTHLSITFDRQITNTHTRTGCYDGCSDHIRSATEGSVPVRPGMETRNPPRLDELVRRHRTAAALSQEELAEKAGLSVRAISDLERGVHRTPRLETVRLVADALGLGEVHRAALLVAARPHVMASGPRQGARSLAPGSLLVPLTRLIGRETEVGAIAQLLARDDVRLVTLTGPGGTGKTRLALEIGAETLDQYPDGVFFIDLAPL